MADVKRLIAEVAARNGIRLDSDDPAFCLVTLNQLVLEEAGQKVAEEIRTATKHFEDAAGKVEGRVGVILGRELREALTSIRRQVESEMGSRTRAPKVIRRWPANGGTRTAWVALGILSGSLVFGFGVLVGIALH